MTRMTAKDFPPELLEYFDFYVHGKMTKREFLDLSAKFVVGGLSAAALTTLMTPNYAYAEQVEFTDPDILAEYIQYPSPQGHGSVRGYLVRPAKASGKVPGVVVVHENRGLNPYIEDVARRVAKAGFIALAPDGLSSVGGYPGNDEKGRELQKNVDPTKLMNDFFAAIEFLMHHETATGKVGITGFCYGGGVANASAVAYPELAAAAPFTAVSRKPKTCRVSKRRYYCIMPSWINRLRKAGLRMKRRSRLTIKCTKAMSIPASITGSITIPLRVMTKRQQIWRGTERWRGSTNIWCKTNFQ